MKSCSYQFA